MNSMIREIIPFLIPIFVVEMILVGVTLRHILTHRNYKRGNRAIWVAVTIIGMQFWGPILYFLFGKEDE
ncbi:MAG: PLDc N-terminal domain-containing protein [Sellimonas sp.]|uniref:PLDc N-terminal domain-containing protein n=1 Tax=Sellimonas sp. TaxID=2021466 RepID=UPI0025984724|nr:PLDc N-terminal domain-containing protein [uncultured Sellimonas sp.]